MFRNWTLKTKTVLFFAFALLLTICIFFLYWYAENSYKHNSTYVEISKQNSLQLQQVVFFIRNIADGKKNNLNNVTREMKILDDNLKLLREGGTYEGLHSITLNPTSEGQLEIFSKLTDVNRQWREFRSRVVRIVDINPIRLDSTFAYLALPDVDPNNMKTQKIDFLNPLVTPNLDYIVKNTERMFMFNEDLTTAYYEYAWEQRRSYFIAISMLTGLLVMFLIGGYFFIIGSTMSLKHISNTVSQLVAGEFTRGIDYNNRDEIGEVITKLNDLVDSMETISTFAANVGKGDFHYNFQVRGENDRLGYALLDMRDNLQKVAEEDNKRNWANEGMAKFAEILRNTQQDLNDISYNIISNLVKYLGANQGGLFILNENNETPTLELSAAYAYNKKKYLEKVVKVGQGLLGQAVLEKNMIYLTEIPNNYITITSGLGEANPNTLLIVPLQANNVIYGVIEIASFLELKDYQMEFVQKLSESIAITISTVKGANKTNKLLEESQMFTELMRAQEEEMRQNMEELTATQEEMRRVQIDIKEKENALNTLINNTDAAILSVDSQLTVKVYNKTALEYFANRGIQLKTGSNFLNNILKKESQELWRQYCEQALQGQSVSELLAEKSLDFIDHYYLVTLQPISDIDNNHTGFTIFVKDVTQLHPVRWEKRKNSLKI
jgi:PAS domain S-box-containing protein